MHRGNYIELVESQKQALRAPFVKGGEIHMVAKKADEKEAEIQDSLDQKNALISKVESADSVAELKDVLIDIINAQYPF